MTASQTKKVEQIRLRYEQKTPDKLDELKKLDKKVNRPALVFSYIFGIIGALVLGTGMCYSMKVIGDNMILGLIVGVLGIAMVSLNYFIYKKILNRRKNKYSAKILELTDSLLND